MSRFTPNLHPRDRRGKFRKGSGGSGSGVGRSGARRSPRKIASNVKTTSMTVAKNRAARPIAKPSSSALAERARKTEVAVAGVNVAKGLKATATLSAGSAVAAGAQQHLLAASLGAKAALSGAYTANEAHHLKTITSSKYKGASIEERSRFDVGYQKRSHVIQKAQSATTIVGAIGAAAEPLIKRKAGSENIKRYIQSENKKASDATRASYYDDRYAGKGAVAVRSGLNASPKLAKKKRGGVYDITSAGSKRVA